MTTNLNSKSRGRGTTAAGLGGLALASVLLLCGAGNAPIENFTPQGAMQADLNAGGHSVTNAATVSATNVAAANLTVNGKTLGVNNTLTLAGTDGSTLNVGAGGTLGSNAYTSTAYVSQTTTVNGHALSGNVTVTAGDVSAIPLSGSTSIPGNLGAGGGGYWEIVEATGAASFAGGDFQIDGDGNMVTDGNALFDSEQCGTTGTGQFYADAYDLQIGDGSGGAYFGNGTIDINGDGELTVDSNTIQLGDGAGDGSASFINGTITMSGDGNFEVCGHTTLDVFGTNEIATDGNGNLSVGSLASVGAVAPGNSSTYGAAIWSGTGAPASGLGANGDFYFRKDGSTSTHLYFKASGSWAGIL